MLNMVSSYCVKLIFSSLMNKLLSVSLSLSLESCKKLLPHAFLFLNSVLIPIYTLYRGFCVLLTLLPGDSPGFDFGKLE